MSTDLELRLASIRDARAIAEMSRDLIEQGLGWSWTPARIEQTVRSVDNVVLVAAAGRRIAGFAIMYFGDEEARLNLLAVASDRRREGIGRKLVEWLEASALVAGISVVYLEVRANNHGAKEFYRRLGYRSVELIAGYYWGRESALRMARDLWEPLLTSER